MKKEESVNSAIVVVTVITLIIIVGLSLFLIFTINVEKGEGDRFVIEVLDGDTFRMSSGETIRLLCVNTPEEGVEGYERAGRFLDSLILYKAVELEQGESLDDVDKYNRELRFVYVNNGGKRIFVNDEVIRLGFGEFYDYGDEFGECNKLLL